MNNWRYKYQRSQQEKKGHAGRMEQKGLLIKKTIRNRWMIERGEVVINRIR